MNSVTKKGFTNVIDQRTKELSEMKSSINAIERRFELEKSKSEKVCIKCINL
jgi:hypothetical protein